MEADTLQVVQLYSCLDRIRTMEWCSRSEYIVCGLQNKQIVQVQNIRGADLLLTRPSCAASMSMLASFCQAHASQP